MSVDDTGKRSSATKTDWSRLRRLTGQEIRAGIEADPEVVPTDDEFWKEARVVMPSSKKLLSLHIDADVVDWFRGQKDYKTLMNTVLRSHMEAHRHRHDLAEEQGAFEPRITPGPPSMDFSHPYFEFCEAVFARWRSGEVSAPEPLQQEYLPEPYLVFGKALRPVVFVTLNPGGGIHEQSREAIAAGDSPVRADLPYLDNARRLAKFYRMTDRINRRARARIDAMLFIAEQIGCDGVVQVEAIPFHSGELSNAGLESLYSSTEVAQYQQNLRAFLRAMPLVVAVSAAKAPFARSPKVNYFARLLGIDLRRATLTVLKQSSGLPTVGVFVDIHPGRVTAITCRDGHNGLPSRALQEALAKALLSSGSASPNAA